MNMFCNFFSFLGGKKGKILESKSPTQGKNTHTHTPKKKKNHHLYDLQVNQTQPIVQRVVYRFLIPAGNQI